MRILPLFRPRKCLYIGLALLLASCTGDQQPITASDAVRPASVVSVSDDGVISAAMDLPFAPDAGGNWWMWGRFPEHEELRIPAGPHEVEFNVSGGVYFVRKPGVEPWHTSILEGVYIGPGGVRLSPDEWYPALRLQMGYEHAEFEGLGYPPLYAWQAEPYSTSPAHGRVVLVGPGRVTFNRHYNSGWFTALLGYGYEGKQGWELWDWISDQRVTLSIRPLTKKLDVICDSVMVTRGNNIGCNASTPNGTLTNIQWAFTDSAGNTIQGPSGPADWGGQMVVGGTVRATGSVDGQPVSDSVAVSVKPRTWNHIRLRVRQDPFPPGHLPSPANVAVPGHLGDSHADSLLSLPVKEITTGPNNGWWFLERPVVEFGFIVHINDPAFATGSDWYKLQTGGNYVLSSGTVVPNGRCSGSQVPVLRQLTREHEGLGSSSLTSHADAARVYLQTGKPHERLERTVGYGPDFLGGFSFLNFAYGKYVDIAVEMEHFAKPHTNTPVADGGPGIVDPAPFPCYARPWWP